MRAKRSFYDALTKWSPPYKIFLLTKQEKTNGGHKMIDRINYTGKIIYMGIDVHKAKYVCVSICESEIVKRDTLPADPEYLLDYMNKFFQGAKINSAYEAGFSGFHLHRFLIQNGINNIVVNPSSIEISSRDRVKTDKRDALKIATQLSVQRLRGIYIPSIEQESQRHLTRLRSSFWKLRHQVGARIKSLLFTQGLIKGDDKSRMTKKWLTEKRLEIEENKLSEGFYYAVNQYAEEWLHLTDKLKVIEERIKAQAKQESVIHTIYTSVPGIGLIHGRQLANELGNMSQFQNEKQLFSYVGLTPSEYSSGEHVRQGHISRQGRSVLRKIMVEASWKAIEKDPNLCDIFERIALHKGKKRAIVGVARRLLGRIRSCLLSGTLYEITSKKKEEKDQPIRTINNHSVLQETALV